MRQRVLWMAWAVTTALALAVIPVTIKAGLELDAAVGNPSLTSSARVWEVGANVLQVTFVVACVLALAVTVIPLVRNSVPVSLVGPVVFVILGIGAALLGYYTWLGVFVLAGLLWLIARMVLAHRQLRTSE